MNVRLQPTDLPGLEPAEAVRQPLRVVVDSRLRTPPGARLLGLPGMTLIACTDQPAPAIAVLESAGALVEVLPEGRGRVDLESLLRHLAEQEVNEVLIEAGPTLAGAAVAAGLVDELVLYLAPHLMGDAARGLFHLPGLERMAERIPLTLTDVRAVGQDWRLTARLG
jgi:diaminohydroxyphosphoribosylaminopyrimidine deaminase/5-amino-6-(5-phosphoribosylamino)uracil reductase